RDLAGSRLLLFGGRGDLGDRRVDLDTGLLHVTDESHELVGHSIETVRHDPKFVMAFTIETARQIAGPHDIQDVDQPAERPGNRPKQQVAEDKCYDQYQ